MTYNKKMINVKKISFNEFKELAPKINELLNNSLQNNIFLTPLWLITWLESYSKTQQSYLLLVEQDQQLIGFAPLMKQTQTWLLAKITTISFINSPEIAADNLDFVSLKGKEELVNNAIFEYFLTNKYDWDILSLDDLAQDSLSLSMAINFFHTDYTLSKSLGQICPYISLEGDWDSFLALKSKNFRQQTRSKRRKYETKLKGSYHNCKNLEQAKYALQKLAKFNPQRWKKQGKKSSFSSRDFQDFHLQIADNFLNENWLDLSYLEADGKIIAVIYNYIYANTVYYYNTAFDPEYYSYSIGRVLMGYSIEHAFKKKQREFNFLRGEHDYKYTWTKQKRYTTNLHIYKKTLLLQLRHHYQKVKLKAITLLKAVIPKETQKKLNPYYLMFKA